MIFKIIRTILVITGLFFLINACSMESGMDVSKLVPGEMNGWNTIDEISTYDRDTIFKYINGAGEVYRQYGFKNVQVYRYTKENEPEMVVELFDMGSSEDAFGVFTHGREGDEAGFGQGSELKGNFLCFWKDHYFVCVYAEGESETVGEAVISVGKAIDGKIQNTGPLPDIIAHLPEANRDDSSLKYFHTHPSLNYHYYLTSTNVLDLGEQTDATLAIYHIGEDKPILLLIRYPDDDTSMKAYNAFIESYMPEGKDSGVLQTENGTWVTVKREMSMIAIVFEAASREGAEELIEAVKY